MRDHGLEFSLLRGGATGHCCNCVVNIFSIPENHYVTQSIRTFICGHYQYLPLRKNCFNLAKELKPSNIILRVLEKG